MRFLTGSFYNLQRHQDFLSLAPTLPCIATYFCECSPSMLNGEPQAVNLPIVSSSIGECTTKLCISVRLQDATPYLQFRNAQCLLLASHFSFVCSQFMVNIS